MKSPGVRALLLLAQLVQSVEEATKNPMLRVFLNRSEEAKALLKDARSILADAKAELDAKGKVSP